MATKAQLLENANSTGDPFSFAGGKAMFRVVGTFGGTTITLESLGPDGATYVPMSAGVSAAGQETFDLPRGIYKAVVTGGTPSGLYADLIRVR